LLASPLQQRSWLNAPDSDSTWRHRSPYFCDAEEAPGRPKKKKRKNAAGDAELAEFEAEIAALEEGGGDEVRA
jgi:hypothetical protein